MNNNDAPTRKTKTPRLKIIRVEDGAGRGEWYYATSTTSAKAMHNENLTARVATDLEIMHIARSGLAVIGLDTEEDDVAQSRFDMPAPTREEDDQ